MNKVFLDANVIFSAVYSETGGSAYILQLAKKGRIKLYSSRLAIKEAERNLREKADIKVVLRFYDLLDEVYIELVDVDRAKAKERFSDLVGEKDSPILASAITSKADFFLTLDKKHLLNQKVLNANLAVKIINPSQFIEKYL